ncbi:MULTISPECIES: TonB-dependent siderophore receptor [unclassified Pseudomonas]|uniref:TonB-dependent receptor n=1 Tax=unclassified Pseudomonas TaxID=196821 RepID=UPI000C885A2C|nr:MULTISPECIES: TonB-dependent siderophore receptor [unclassified Pseudomonas]PMX27487.1 TonB-dependent siderophore receptor [Pseudomonas sp. GW460-12]PMX29193.1 TonB-dependent siderophore receptor [Pseudomonas sp. MPR-R2A4]PMX41852.1 TonB-dependent siderophore receptor [Pseudomonas sp. MPR-R2A7]PMX46789.1 TonB-dependent siderophore receptor [Pseudomonas sp. MPR-R2A6]PMX91289.1 TonB-dependent siderophore receptor [Pseudomonas sp. MPR-R2A3]
MRIETLRPVLSGFGAVASLASGVFFAATDQAHAEETAPASKPDDATIQLPATTIEGTHEPSTNALKAETGLDRLPDTLQSTPQTITVIPQLVIEQQHATTIDQVLKYVPGVTVATGEGNGGINGDQFRIRGFDASGDIYVDGLRDFGAYVRDSFATENVMVLKGPSSQSFGNGTTGGAIELDSKKAHLGDANSLNLTAGQGPYKRGVLDVNHQINDTTAVRAVIMGQAQDVVDRDHVYSDRSGFLGSIGFGLGTSQQLTVNYFHQSSKSRPDFGVPTGSIGTSDSEPLTEHGLSRSNFYGRESDRDRMDADVATVRYKGEFNDWLTLTNDTRYGHYTRDLKFTPSFCMDLPAAVAGFYGVPASTCASDVSAGNLNTNYTLWPVGGFRLKSYGAENITTAVMNFDTGRFRHELVVGFDAYYQHQQANFYFPSGSGSSGTLLDPTYDNPAGFTLNLDSNGITAHSRDFAPFVSERLWLTPELSILGGVRRDFYEVDGDNAGASLATTTEFTSPKGSVIWEPTSHQTYYVSYAKSFTPPGSNITTLGSSVSLAGGSRISDMDPETAKSYEVGGKWSFLDDRLGTTAALFRVSKDNSTYTDPTSGIQSASGDKVRVQGVELGLTGKITPAWDVQASYSYMHSKILNTSTASSIGNLVPYVSKNSAALWTTYDLAPLVRDLPGHLLVGGGVNYRSEYYMDNAMASRIPGTTTTDAMLSYDIDQYNVALNVTNLTNELAYSAAFANRYATPIAGRTVSLSAGVKF